MRWHRWAHTTRETKPSKLILHGYQGDGSFSAGRGRDNMMTFGVVHRDPQLALVLPTFVHTDDVRVLQGGGQVSLAPEADTVTPLRSGWSLSSFWGRHPARPSAQGVD